MKLPRRVSSDRLVRALARLGYEAIRQKGSHIRMVHRAQPVHFITIPAHNPMKTGTLHGIVAEVARARSIEMDELLKLL